MKRQAVTDGQPFSFCCLRYRQYGSCPTAAMAGPVKLSYANFPPPVTFPCVQMERWKTEVEKRTNGKVAINTFPGSTLLGPKDMMDGVIAGTADIGNLCQAYQPGRFVLSNATALPLGFPMHGLAVSCCGISTRNIPLNLLTR